MGNDHYDVLVIGSGPGGATTAARVAEPGKRVLMLERGDFLPRERDNWNSRAAFGDAKYTAGETFYDSRDRPFRPELHYCVGGNSKVYGAALRRLPTARSPGTRSTSGCPARTFPSPTAGSRSGLTARSGWRCGPATTPKASPEVHAIAGPDRVRLMSAVPLYGDHWDTRADFTVRKGDRVPFVLSWAPGHDPQTPYADAEQALSATEDFWTGWSAHAAYQPGPYDDAVDRSLITLEALTYEPTGGIVAAATTSLPEELGGVRNWDYR
jgi:choline dehydrogenase-like flavoprotein